MNDILQALISSRWYSKVPPQTGEGRWSRTPKLNYLNDIDTLGSYQPGSRESTNVMHAPGWDSLSVKDKFILKFLMGQDPSQNQIYPPDPMLPGPR